MDEGSDYRRNTNPSARTNSMTVLPPVGIYDARGNTRPTRHARFRFPKVARVVATCRVAYLAGHVFSFFILLEVGANLSLLLARASVPPRSIAMRYRAIAELSTRPTKTFGPCRRVFYTRDRRECQCERYPLPGSVPPVRITPGRSRMEQDGSARVLRRTAGTRPKRQSGKQIIFRSGAANGAQEFQG